VRKISEFSKTTLYNSAQTFQSIANL